MEASGRRPGQRLPRPLVQPPVQRVVELDAPADVVWGMVTRSDELAAWFGADADVDPRPGGPVRFRWPDGTERGGVVETAERHRRFAFRWRKIGPTAQGTGMGAASRVEFLIEPIGGRTRLTVTEHPGVVRADAPPTEFPGGPEASPRTSPHTPSTRASA